MQLHRQGFVTLSGLLKDGILALRATAPRAALCNPLYDCTLRKSAKQLRAVCNPLVTAVDYAI